MQVLHISAGNLYGGIESLLTTLARNATLYPTLKPQFALCFEGWLTQELAVAEATFHMLGGVRVSRPWTVCRARRRLDTLLGQVPIDVAICHGCWSHALFAPIVRARGGRLVYWAHGPHSGRHWLERWARRIQPDLVLANSRWTRSTLFNLFPDVPSEVLYLPVPPAATVERDRLRQQLCNLLDTPVQTTIIIQASRLERWKGHRLLVEALGRLKTLPNWVCWMVGGSQRRREGVYFQELQASAIRAGISDRVRFLGQRSDLPQLLAAADIFCQPNIEPEPFGLVFVEALYAGLPVITMAMGGVLEIVDDSCGVLVPRDDVGTLAAALDRLIHDLAVRKKLGAAGPARARQLCDPLRQIGRLKDVLARVCLT